MMAMGTSIQTVPTVGLSVKTMKHAGVSMKVRACPRHDWPWGPLPPRKRWHLAALAALSLRGRAAAVSRSFAREVLAQLCACTGW